jgi:hypothetical protein
LEEFGLTALRRFELPEAAGMIAAANEQDLGAPKPFQQDRRTPEQIARHIHIWDRGVAVATALATAFVYVVTTYGDKDFGSVRDYVAAVAVGFVGQGIAIAWNLFPTFRSTALPPKAATAPMQ